MRKVFTAPYGEDTRGTLDIRKYFEEGCRCVLEGKVVKAPPETVYEALWDWYNDQCQCGRGYDEKGRVSQLERR